MIRSWKNDASQELWTQQASRRHRGLDHEVAIDLLLALNIARSPDDLAPLRCAGLRQKKGRDKRWTLAIDDRRHIRFDLHKGDAVDVKIVGKDVGKKSGKTRVAKPAKAKSKSTAPAVHPGRFLRRELAARQLSANRLALDLGVPSGRITDILNARRAITADTAVRLGRYLGTSAQFWLDLQSQFDIAVVERKKGAEIGRRVRATNAT